MLQMSTLKVVRINHVKSLCDRRGWSRPTAMREIIYHGMITRNTAEKAYNGETDLSMETVEKLAALFQVTKEEVLESRFK